MGWDVPRARRDPRPSFEEFVRKHANFNPHMQLAKWRLASVYP